MQATQGAPPDSVRAVLRGVFAGPAYEWSGRRHPLEYLVAGWRWLQAALQRLQELHPIGFLALMLALTIIGAALLTHIGFILWRALRPAARQEPAEAGPLPPARDAAWHLSHARRLAAAGNYGEALGHRFVALVLQLESRRAVLVRASKTPAEYAREVRLDPAGRGAFDALVATLYGAVFGGRACDAEAFAAFDRTAAELVQRAQAV
jgi:Domain of unknown function (DUF4129)